MTEIDVDKIKRLHNEFLRVGQTVLNIAIEIGELLLNKKRTKAHGEWLPWVEANLPFSQEWASFYMRCFTHQDELKLEPPGSNMSLRGARKALTGKGKHKAKRPKVADSPVSSNGSDPVGELLKLLSSGASGADVQSLKKGLTKSQLAIVGGELSQNREDAARLVGVSTAQVSRARRIVRESPNLVRRVRDGSILLNQAYNEVCYRHAAEKAMARGVSFDPQTPMAMIHEYGSKACQTDRLLPRDLERVHNSISAPTTGITYFILELVADREIGRAKVIAVAKRAERRRLREAKLAVDAGAADTSKAELHIQCWGRKAE